MSEKLLELLLKKGKVRRQSAGFSQIEALLGEAILDLEEAKKIKDIAERATYLLAYMAMLKTGRAFLLLYGYVPDDGGQHKTVVEASGSLLGEKYKEIILQFETMRRKRNELTYEAGTLLSGSEARRAFEDAIDFTKMVLKEVKRKNPQLALDFER